MYNVPIELAVYKLVNLASKVKKCLMELYMAISQRP